MLKRCMGPYPHHNPICINFVGSINNHLPRSALIDESGYVAGVNRPLWNLFLEKRS